ncbi:FabD/lysophospholipase-like protein [Ascoidea rubescens DSM 1968]|uniref:Lysophospholipase n=1 Tax=Ascoidea rubescens DSM 1968 TaxID=1344418 RepID=A0A1D2VJB8_9ASCO|nr:FabD/lysophospholipase-like protein [Ascoidea rubescens DSM 1968]ODV61719.1 FabD/lysophospholipase-like protein [Ascoidea rubescens DSM 1968]
MPILKKNLKTKTSLSSFKKNLNGNPKITKEKEFIFNNDQLKKNSITNFRKILTFYRNLHRDVRDKKLAGFHISFTDYWGRALSKKILPFQENKSLTFSSVRKLPSFKNYDLPFPILISNLRWPTNDLEKINNDLIDSKTSQIFEFNPYEFGSWESYLEAFVKIKYLGTMLNDGIPIFKINNNSICVNGFDNIGFITATSSSLFNSVIFFIWKLIGRSKKETYTAFNTVLKIFGLNINDNNQSTGFNKHHPDYALFSPNPFFGYNHGKNSLKISKIPHLFLVDGGEDGQNVPFQPFLTVKNREVDLIIAIDSTSDKCNYPNGTTLKLTAQRYHGSSFIDNNNQSTYESIMNTSRNNFDYINNRNNEKLKNSTKIKIENRHDDIPSSFWTAVGDKEKIVEHDIFPEIPDLGDLVKNNFNKKPVFFGCDLDKAYPVRAFNNKNAEHKDKTKTKIKTRNNNGTKKIWFPPLIVYFPNSNYTFESNQSTFKLQYGHDEECKMIENGYSILTYGNSSSYLTNKENYETENIRFDQCMGCAAMKREFDRIERGINRNYFQKESKHNLKKNIYYSVNNQTEIFEIPKICVKCFEKFCYN